MTDMASLPSYVERAIYNYIHIKTKDTGHPALIAMSRLDILVEFLFTKISVSGRCPSNVCWSYWGFRLSHVQNSVAVLVSGEFGILSAIGSIERWHSSL